MSDADRVEIGLLRLVGSGLVTLAPALTAVPSGYARLPGDAIIKSLTVAAPERVPGFVETTIEVLWSNCRAELSDGSAARTIERLVALLESDPFSEDVADAAAQRVRTTKPRRDAISSEGRRLASAVLNFAGGGADLRAQGIDPLAVLKLSDSLYGALLAELPFLDDIASLIAVVLTGEPPVRKLPGRMRVDLEANIAANTYLTRESEGVSRYAAHKLDELRTQLLRYADHAGLPPESGNALLGHIETGSVFVLDSALAEHESRHLRQSMENLQASSSNSILAASVRSMRASLSEVVADFDRAGRHHQSALRIVRVLSMVSSWPTIRRHIAGLRDRGLFLDERDTLVAARDAVAKVLMGLQAQDGAGERAEAELLCAEILVTDRHVSDPIGSWLEAIERAQVAGSTFRNAGNIGLAITSDHVAATGYRLIGTVRDDEDYLAQSAELYDGIVETLDPDRELPIARASWMLSRRYDSIRGAWCVVAHLASLREDVDTLAQLATMPGGLASSTNPFVLCPGYDLIFARIRAEATEALMSADAHRLAAASDAVERALAEIPADGMKFERAALHDQLGTILTHSATNQGDAEPTLGSALAYKKRAREVFAAIDHPRCHEIDIELRALESAMGLIQADEATH
ncbi:MAG: hypothetical protein AAF732_02760 [Pseudomonadota bacterium]